MSRHQGQEVETAAATFLQQQGLKILARNYHCRLGEIDLIAQQGKTLIFVEVRFRKSAAFGNAAESVTSSKQQKIMMTAQHFLQNHPKLQNLCCRFDVIACNPGNQQTVQMDWIKGAFSA